MVGVHVVAAVLRGLIGPHHPPDEDPCRGYQQRDAQRANVPSTRRTHEDGVNNKNNNTKISSGTPAYIQCAMMQKEKKKRQHMQEANVLAHVGGAHAHNEPPHADEVSDQQQQEEA